VEMRTLPSVSGEPDAIDGGNVHNLH
jgi:hypothetical protein